MIDIYHGLYSFSSSSIEQARALAELPTLLWDQAGHFLQTSLKLKAAHIVKMSGLAETLKLGHLFVQDESMRLAEEGLHSFKTLGAPYALAKLLQEQLSDDQGWTIDLDTLASGQAQIAVGAMTAIAATDGNHGRALAWAARRFGCRCRIHVPEDISDYRAAAIEQQGAKLIRAEGPYDQAVAAARLEAIDPLTIEVTDTAEPFYESSARFIVAGYAWMARSALAALPQPATHVIVQGGVGGLPAAVALALRSDPRSAKAKLIVVEPQNAACLLASAKAGQRVSLTGNTHSIMVGLACGTPSSLAWRILEPLTDIWLAFDDAWAIPAMIAFQDSVDDDPSLVIGETGSAGLAALLAIGSSPEVRSSPILRFDQDSCVLLFATEGNTDPESRQRLITQGLS